MVHGHRPAHLRRLQGVHEGLPEAARPPRGADLDQGLRDGRRAGRHLQHAAPLHDVRGPALPQGLPSAPPSAPTRASSSSTPTTASAPAPAWRPAPTRRVLQLAGPAACRRMPMPNTPQMPIAQGGTVGKCVLCADRLPQGDLPACVDKCPMGVLYVGDLVDDVAVNGPGTTVILSEFLHDNDAVRFKEELATDPRVCTSSARPDPRGRVMTAGAREASLARSAGRAAPGGSPCRRLVPGGCSSASTPGRSSSAKGMGLRGVQRPRVLGDLHRRRRHLHRRQLRRCGGLRRSCA